MHPTLIAAIKIANEITDFSNWTRTLSFLLSFKFINTLEILLANLSKSVKVILSFSVSMNIFSELLWLEKI